MGVGNGSSLGTFRKELRVDDLPRIPSRVRVGDDDVEAPDPCRKRGTPGPVKSDGDLAKRLWDGEGSGDANPWVATSSADVVRSAFTAEDSVPGVTADAPIDGRGAARE